MEVCEFQYVFNLDGGSLWVSICLQSWRWKFEFQYVFNLDGGSLWISICLQSWRWKFVNFNMSSILTVEVCEFQYAFSLDGGSLWISICLQCLSGFESNNESVNISRSSIGFSNNRKFGHFSFFITVTWERYESRSKFSWEFWSLRTLEKKSNIFKSGNSVETNMKMSPSDL